MCCAFLLQQSHPFRVRIPAAADDAVQVNAAGHAGAREVGAVPHCLVALSPSVALYAICCRPGFNT